MRAIFLTGPSACGKSAIGRALQARLGEPWLFYEVDRCQPVGVATWTLPVDDAATAGLDRRMQRANLYAARCYLNEGFSLIIEADIRGLESTEVGAGFADFDPILLDLVGRPEDLRERHSERGGPTSTVIEEHWRTWQPVADALTLETSGRTFAETVDEILVCIAAR